MQLSTVDLHPQSMTIEVATHTPASTATARALIQLKLHLNFCSDERYYL